MQMLWDRWVARDGDVYPRFCVEKQKLARRMNSLDYVGTIPVVRCPQCKHDGSQDFSFLAVLVPLCIAWG